jgi:hypothetical protein
MSLRPSSGKSVGQPMNSELGPRLDGGDEPRDMPTRQSKPVDIDDMVCPSTETEPLKTLCTTVRILAWMDATDNFVYVRSSFV